jgi:putative FmdB family regulatory protein
MPLYDFACTCGTTCEELAAIDEEVRCPTCDDVMKRQISAPHVFTTIIPTYPGSGKHKAGYVHKHVNRPATKTQVGYGGGVSPDHPKK